MNKYDGRDIPIAWIDSEESECLDSSVNLFDYLNNRYNSKSNRDPEEVSQCGSEDCLHSKFLHD